MKHVHCPCLYLLAFLSILVIPSGLLAQPEGGVGLLLPAPIYPKDGNVDLLFPDQFVFFDARTFDVILAYRPTSTAPRKVHRIELSVHVAPKIVSTVSETPQGEYRYVYRVANGPVSRQPIRTWFLSVPQPGPPQDSKFGRSATEGLAQEKAWSRNLYSLRPGRWTVRFDSQPEMQLTSGQSAAFVVESKHRPGIVSAYFQGAVSAASLLPDDLPAAAREQLEKIKRIQGVEYDHKAAWTIGPKYNRTIPSIEIAAGFHVGFSNLLHRGVLDHGSPFVREVLARLEEFLQRPRPPDVAPAVDESFRSIGQPPNPESIAERQLDMALKLALVRP